MRLRCVFRALPRDFEPNGSADKQAQEPPVTGRKPGGGAFDS